MNPLNVPLRVQCKGSTRVLWGLGFEDPCTLTLKAQRTHILRLLGPKTLIDKAVGLF